MLSSCICLGPKSSGKTHLLTALQNLSVVDNTTHSIPTIGTNIFTIKLPINGNDGMNSINSNSGSTSSGGSSSSGSNNKKSNSNKSVQILEIGGSMAPLWRQYFNNVNKLIYVVDTSNLCQISAAGVLLYSILAEPRLQHTKFLLVLTKMDLAYRQMRNEALLILQMIKLKKQIRQNFTITEASAITGHGLNDIYKWLEIS